MRRSTIVQLPCTKQEANYYSDNINVQASRANATILLLQKDLNEPTLEEGDRQTN